MKKMITLFTLIIIGTSLQAQPPQKREELEALRIAYISKQLELTPAEAEKFWPVYNHFQTLQRNMMREQREKQIPELEFQEKMLNLRKQSKPEFLKAISEQKFDKMLRIERSWGEMLRKELQRRGQGGGRPGMMGRPPQGNPPVNKDN